MSDRQTRPAPELIKDAYDRLFRSGLSQVKIKDAAIGGRLFPSSDDDAGIAGRSLAWKLFLLADEPLQLPAGAPSILPVEPLRVSRKNYVELLLEKMRAPDGSYEEGFSVPGSSTPPKSNKKASNLETNNPLSLHDENPWKEWFASVDLRKTILQDVERTFPDIGYFRDVEVQNQLTNILYLYSIAYPSIGYRQGMHELLAPLYYAVDYDSIPEGTSSTLDSDLVETCSRTWVAADAWALFLAVMHGVSRWYEWRESDDTSGVGASTSPLANQVQLNSDGKVNLKPYVAPIVQACNHIQGNLLRTVDPLLWKKLQDAGIEPQIYGIRWLRLLFTRELNMQDAMILWDGLFACDPTFEIVQWICVAMLVRIRNNLIPADYSTQLTYLLRYPSPPTSNALDLPHHATLLLRQAVALQISPNPSAGASIVVENRNLLNIPVEVPEPPPAPARRRARPGERPGGHQMSASDGPLLDAGRPGLPRQHSHQMGLPESIARNLLDRGESMGINKTFLSAVSELRRNLPDLASSLVRIPPSPSGGPASYAAFPLTDERPPEQRPPWEPRSRFEMERDISDLRDANKKLGKSVGWIVDVLLQDEDGVKDPENLKQIKLKKREALESLSYVRDVLNGSVVGIEEERLWGEQEFERRRSQEVATRRSRDSGAFERDSRTLAVPPPQDARLKGTTGSSKPVSPVPAPLQRPRHSPSTSLSSSLEVQRPSGLGSPAQVAPWHSTRSSFTGAGSPGLSSSLPRIPPPTSTSYKPPPRMPSPASERGRSASPNSQIASGTRSPRLEIEHDPLGVL